ncbi:MAG: hypothetical protein EXR75_00695 [Myxococcales bacterium]|nr:hypothetical protein [Myxococcales bacterium]
MSAIGRFQFVLGVTLAAFVACAYPEFDYRPGGNGPIVSVSTTGGAGGTTTSTTGGAGGVETCELGVFGACGAGQKCTVAPGTGTIGCGGAGPFLAWAKCEADADCVEGTWCDAPFRVCKPLCKSAADCNFLAQGTCIEAVDKTGTKIVHAELKHCVPNCDPRTGLPCDIANDVTCFVRDTDFDCGKSVGLTAGQKCASSLDCVSGTVCVGAESSATCASWCANPKNAKLPHPDCHGFDAPVCRGLTQTIKYLGIEHGVCGPVF